MNIPYEQGLCIDLVIVRLSLSVLLVNKMLFKHNKEGS